jgi:hypothetical protein
VSRFWIFDGSTSLTTGFGFWIASPNSLYLWERARVRAKPIHVTLTSILSLHGRARK